MIKNVQMYNLIIETKRRYGVADDCMFGNNDIYTHTDEDERWK